MACTKLSYQRLRNSPESSTQEGHQENKNEALGDHQQQKEEEEEEDGGGGDEQEVVVVVKRSRSSRRWLRLRSGGGKRWRRPRVRIAGLRRLLRRKAKVVGNAVRVSVAKVMTRLKQGKPFIGELFAGNYMFMQVSPSPTMAINSTMDKLKLANGNGFHHHYNI
ncbi:hypothetical protein J5N97_015179 [Dioscorea zingiberensis]|uniref:Uncharacterized protein n=1 Tax=Dioscorea zingiberensis TaxID=325984 RepID=A0A9D5CWP2_9LILI|nr:hypothetical protein J5N97_015179 [Dioscorea zingiberensis]